MNRDTRTCRRPLAFIAFCVVLLIVAFSSAARAQTVPADPPATLQSMAQDMSQLLSPRKTFKVVVLDFGGPGAGSAPFGAYLADQFSAELSKVSGKLEVLDRSQVHDVQNLLPQKPGTPADVTNKAIAKKAGAKCVISGSYAEFNGDLGMTLFTDCPRAARNSSSAIYRRVVFSPEMAARLGAPVESLRPNSSIVNPGIAGVTYPSCLYCPQASYSQEAVDAKLQGTVTLSAVITAEGRASNIQVTKALGHGLDQKAVEAVSEWRFKPAIGPSGKPVSVRQTIEVTFHLN
jgi:TonB family protein